MGDNRIVFDGLPELIQALRQLPEDLAGEAQHVVIGAANAAAAQVKAHYARVSGDLLAGVEVTEGHTQFSAGAQVKSKSPHAWMYENGTQVRHISTGANRGVMPPAPPGRAFIPAMRQKRKPMYQALKDLLTRKGLLVTGDA